MVAKLDDEVRRLNLVVPVAWVRRIDAWRAQQPGVPNLSAAVRLLVEQALDAQRQKSRKRSGASSV